ncbi:hypothetical protein GCM10023201_02480 [Actinomycetospora corticicola]|uniref:Uncharacterized protein n=1 Tax=Actinomycetospora corticicola TaxID=663602 RepID=A0A7Y9E2T3_9PSEU|nr:hypothetical protein [Actinomycetospora corticicola]NYD39916.1 hypothetical protein [Actinomycetospora corticicola]
MSTPGFDVDVAQLEGIAAALDDATARLAATAAGGGDVPRAGAVTGDVVAFVAALSRSVTELLEGTVVEAGSARAAAGAYRSSDAHARSAFGAGS